MKRSLSIVLVAILLLTNLIGTAPIVMAQETPQAPDTTATPTANPDGQEGTGESPEQTRSLYLPGISNESGEDGSSQEETLTVSELILEQEAPSETGEKPEGAQGNTSEGQVPPEPGMEELLIESDDAKASVFEDDAIVEPAAIDGWTTIMSEGFEGAFPNSSWRTFDNDGTTSGQYYWDDESYKPYSGSWSAWPAGAGANALSPHSYNYPNNMRSYMVYGPFDLRNATDAELLFNYWNLSEANYDYFHWLASVNGSNFYGWKVSGNSSGWRSVNFDLTSVPTLGNLSGRSSVWIAFYFGSDGSITNKGPFVDNIKLQKLVNTSSCSNQYKAEYFNNRTLSGSPTVTRCENWPLNHNWGNGNPASGIGSDNFSVRWTGTAYISAGTYTFLAAADDGIRVWLDNVLIISAWRDQGPTAYRANRSVSSGNHTIRVEYYEYGGGAVAQFGWSPAVLNNVPGITASTRNGFNVYKVDLWSSNLTLETVMANDARSGDTTNVEYVHEMVGRAPYNSRNPVLAFNADYFGQGHHGAEGLTVKNGVRLPNAGRNNGEEWRRSSLSISASKGPRVGPQTDCRSNCSGWTPDAHAYYNTVGGGPLFVTNGARIGGSGSTQPCTNEFLQTGYCTSAFKWTAAGISSDGRYLIVIVSSTNKTMNDAAAVLIAEGAWRAMKFDGGGSTQLWYKPSGKVINGDRRVTNALVIFSSQ